MILTADRITPENITALAPNEAIGCGLAGYEPKQIAPLFLDVINLANVALPKSFWRALGYCVL